MTERKIPRDETKRRLQAVETALRDVFESLYLLRQDMGARLPNEADVEITICIGMCREALAACAQGPNGILLAKYPAGTPPKVKTDATEGSEAR